MRDWEEKRSNEISENILVTHIVSLLIFLMIILSYFGYSSWSPSSNSLFSLETLVLAFFTIALVYIARKLLARFTFIDQPRIDEILLLAITLPITYAFLWYSHGFTAAKILVIIPAIITAIAFGKTIGVGEALASCGLLFLVDYFMHRSVPTDVFQTNLIITGVATLLAWLVGGLIEVERSTQQELLRLADYDPLTGLINCRFLHEKLAVSIQESATGKYPLSLAMLDIGQLNYYNQVYGYHKGDEILDAIGKHLQDNIREPYYAARYGSDEFVLVFPRQDEPSARSLASEITERLIKQIATVLPSASLADSRRDFTVSVGLACHTGKGDKNAVLPLIKAAEDDLSRIRYSKTDYMYKSVISRLGNLSIRDAFPTLRTFLTLVNNKDQYTYSHTERVLAYAMSLGDSLDLSELDMELLRYASYLHDIGKIEIESTLLNKTDSLTDEEWQIMKQHPIHGSELLRPIISYLPLVPIIRSHHENYDGTGYPDGRHGESIPHLSRIIRIADSFDAMTTDRPYRQAMTAEEACSELRSLAGIQYDRMMVYYFLDVVRDIYQTA